MPHIGVIGPHHMSRVDHLDPNLMTDPSKAVQAIKHLKPFRRGDRRSLDEDILHVDNE
jgi:hypothetical protein